MGGVRDARPLALLALVCARQTHHLTPMDHTPSQDAQLDSDTADALSEAHSIRLHMQSQVSAIMLVVVAVIMLSVYGVSCNAQTIDCWNNIDVPCSVEFLDCGHVGYERIVNLDVWATFNKVSCGMRSHGVTATLTLSLELLPLAEVRYKLFVRARRNRLVQLLLRSMRTCRTVKRQ